MFINLLGLANFLALIINNQWSLTKLRPLQPRMISIACLRKTILWIWKTFLDQDNVKEYVHQINIFVVVFHLILQQNFNYNWQWIYVTWMEVSPPISGVPVPETKVLKLTMPYYITVCTQIFDLFMIEFIFTYFSYQDRSQGRLHQYRNWDRQGPGWYM